VAAWSRLTGFKFTEVANRSNYFLQGPHTEPDIVEKVRTRFRLESGWCLWLCCLSGQYHSLDLSHAASLNVHLQRPSSPFARVSAPISPSHPASARFQLHKSIASGKPSSVRMINYTKTGEPFYNSLRVHPLRDLHGRITHYCGVLQGEPVPQGVVPPLKRGKDELSAPELVAAKVEQEEEEAAAASIRVRLLPSMPPPQLTGVKRDRRCTSLHDAIDNTKDAVVITQARPPYAITHVNAPWCEMCG
jgi:hypothetical protein